MNTFEQMPFSEKYPVFRKLAEIGDLRKLSREELELYDEDIKNMRDIYATRKFDEKRGMEKGMAKGMEIGMEKGIAKGMEKEKLATAHRLLSMGLIVQCCHIIALILLFSLHLQPLRFLRNANYAIKNEIAKCFLVF